MTKQVEYKGKTYQVDIILESDNNCRFSVNGMNMLWYIENTFIADIEVLKEYIIHAIKTYSKTDFKANSGRDILYKEKNIKPLIIFNKWDGKL